MVPTELSSEQGHLTQVFHCLTDPTRRAIIAQLASGPCRITELAAPFNMSFPAVSKHIRVLEAANLVRRQVGGREHWFSLSPEPLFEAQQWLDNYRLFWEGQLDALASYVEEQNKR